MPEEIVIQKFLPHNQVARYLALGDFAINPVKPVPTKKYCTSIKDGEYWATGLPVIITKDISDDSNIIASEDIGYVLQQLDREEYKRAIRKIDSLIQSETTHVRIREIAVRYRNFDIAEKIYRRIYSKL
jgi:glycosyltransferase involved in cell wall biosynthesis